MSHHQPEHQLSTALTAIIISLNINYYQPDHQSLTLKIFLFILFTNYSTVFVTAAISDPTVWLIIISLNMNHYQPEHQSLSAWTSIIISQNINHYQPEHQSLSAWTSMNSSNYHTLSWHLLSLNINQSIIKLPYIYWLLLSLNNQLINYEHLQ